ncbi:MAG: lipid-A-disaccharide synthase [Merismopedia sp. SIO2A8]|nr:lipid-A-disaccharide synthase [Merismopedia sp. SIO2A8]
MNPVDILVLSNGPGEVSTWVRPVVQSLRQQLGEDRTQVRISLILSPCPNASGKEVAIARQYSEIDRIQGASAFFPFLLLGKTNEDWDWRDRGMVIFLGGDQLFPIIIGKRLGYRILIYGEWDTRWHPWGDRYAIMNEAVLQKAPAHYHHKFTVVGDLMADIPVPRAGEARNTEELIQNPKPKTQNPLIACLPGSKPAKLNLGVPLCLGIMEHVHAQYPDVEFVAFVAPGITVEMLVPYTQAATNPVCAMMHSPDVTLKHDGDRSYFESQTGAKLHLHTEFPAYNPLRQAQLALTTVGANTAELGALGIPMLVLLPAFQMDAMRSWDGIPGLLSNIPGVGRFISLIFNYQFANRKWLVAWPNIWAGEEIVPEILGTFQPKEIAEKVINYLENPELLDDMRDRLRQVRGEPGAGAKLSAMVVEELQLLQNHPARNQG